MSQFTDQLAALCSDHPTRSKWVFVPSHAVGHTIGDRLVLDGTDWANLRFVTPLDIALRMGAPFLVEKDMDPSEEGLGPALMMKLLLSLPKRHEYFRPLANQPQMAIALWSTIRELRSAGVRGSELRSKGFASSAKFEEFKALVEAYEWFLVNNQRGDRKTVFREAMRHPDWCPIKKQDCWTLIPDVVWSGIEREVLEIMPGEFIEPRSVSIPGATLPRRLEGIDVDRSRPDPAAQLSFLLAPDQAAKPDLFTGNRLTMFTSGGPEAEVEEVFRRILASGATLDDVEIACGSRSYATLIWEKACRYDWPVTLSMGLPVTLTRPGRALLSLTEWIGDDFAAGRLRRLLESGDVATPKRAARLLVRAKAGWGRQTYRRSLGKLSKSERTRADRDDIPEDEREGYRRRADEADELATWIDSLLALIPTPDKDGQVEVQALVTGAETVVSEHAARMSALDAAGATVLAGALRELRALDDFRCPLGQALRFVRERAEGLNVGADRSRPGHLHVSTLSQAAIPHRRHLFVVGLEEGRVFPATFEDPILLDEERRAISPSLGLSTDRTDEAVYAALARLASASATPDVEICFSYSCRDLRQFRETYASWLMLQAYRVMKGNPSAPYSDMHAELRPPKSVVPEAPERALDEGRWWLHGVTRAGGEAGRDAVLERYPSLAAGVRAIDARESDQFTEYDGFVPEAGPVLDPAADGQVVSPTRLEGAAGCPFRFFLERGLGVRAIESGERSRDVWLDPLIRGSLLHDLYAGFWRRCRAEDRRPSLAQDRDWLLDAARNTLDELEKDMPPPSPDVEARETADLVEDLELFLQAECDLDPTRTPVGFEVGFGRAGSSNVDEDAKEPLASDQPVEIPLGDLTVRVAGRVDRIDRIEGAGGPTFEILDYKTGRYWRDDWEGTFAGGRMLQHALYGLAVADLLRKSGEKGTVSGAQYYFSSTKGRQQRKVIPTPATGDVAAVLADLRDVITNGLFVHAPEDGECKFCDYGHACGRNAHERATFKADDPALEPYRKLVAHD